MITCKICGIECKSIQSLSRHILFHHEKYNSKIYYDEFIKGDSEGLCLKCGTDTKFKTMGKGYDKYCSKKCSQLGRTQTDEIKDKIKQTKLERYGNSNYNNREGAKLTLLERYGVENISQLSDVKAKKKSKRSKYINGVPMFEHYSPLISWCEDTRPDLEDERIINVRCIKCSEWFRPTKSEMKNRIHSINRSGIDLSKFYCSDGCKHTCSIFNKQQYPEGQNPNIERPYQTEWAKMVLDRDNYECQRCGSKDNLVAHHIKPVKTHPLLQADVDNGLTVCSDCDKNYFHQIDGCKTGQLARMVCN